ncbi:hypothetical protein [Psychromonas sp. Urea-02u-13]|nr:hypothetical protein [Psychromonas sp. Urea-02u-13]
MKEYIVDFTGEKGRSCRVRVFARDSGDAKKRIKEEHVVMAWRQTKEIK